LSLAHVSGNTFKFSITNTSGQTASVNSTLEVYAGGAGDNAAGYITSLEAI
jgi:hypothetical protein